MLHYLDADITTVGNGIIAHGVNCSGKMNSGVARAIRNKWPITYERFKQHPTGKTALGDADIIYIPDEETIIANCYTQVFYGYGGGKYADVKAIQQSLLKVAQIANLHSCSVYIPRIGCGLGGLTWSTEVEPAIQQIFNIYDQLTIFVCDLPGEVK